MNKGNSAQPQPEKSPPPEPKAPASAPAPQPAAPQPEPPGSDLAELQRKAEEHDKLVDRLKRVTADYMNSQRRMERRAEERTAYAIESFARELLPVADDLSRAIAAAREHSASESVSEGLELVEKHLYGVLARHGITPIETNPGDPFDSKIHEAISVVHTDELPPNSVAEVKQKGFSLHERVLRPARVVVSAPKPKTP